MPRNITLGINGQRHEISVDEGRPLLDLLREDLQLTGTKYGCGEGECGACTVLANGKAIRSCITPAAEVDGQEIKTIEGLANERGLHPVQSAFLEKQAMQCGYCIPGQILSAVALLEENPHPSREQIIDAMQGNICRCCNYSTILAAVEKAAEE